MSRTVPCRECCLYVYWCWPEQRPDRVSCRHPVDYQHDPLAYRYPAQLGGGCVGDIAKKLYQSTQVDRHHHHHSSCHTCSAPWRSKLQGMGSLQDLWRCGKLGIDLAMCRHTHCVQALAALSLICVLSVKLVQRWFYEFFLRSHVVLSLLGVVALFQHLSARKLTSRLYLLAGFGLWAFLALCQFAGYCFRNLVWGRRLGRTIVTEVPGACHLVVDVPRPWNVRAGQYVYLWFPTASVMSFWQSHPYMIIWWSETKNSSGTLTSLKLSMLVQGRRGLSRRLGQLSYRELPTLIGGPYGELHNFGAFGTCLMFATGIGIASILPHVKAVVDGYRRFEVCTRRIVLVWEIEHESRF